MAAHLEGKGVGVIDMAGLAQKGGAVYSHIRIANTANDIHAIRVAAAGADLVLGGDIVVVGNKKVLGAIKPGHTRVVINTAEFLPGDFARNANYSLPTERLKRGIVEHSANAILVKPNQIGTLSETLDVIRRAKDAGYRTVVSARSGETEDSFLADLAVGSAAGQIKVGSVTRSSRLSKWNQLLRIEEEIGTQGYVGFAALALPDGTL